MSLKNPLPAPPTLVLVHGALNDHTVWTPQRSALAGRGIPVLTPDLPGHGPSAGPALPSIEAMADWLLAWLDGAGVDQVVLAGHSMGALVVLEAAQRAPHRVAGLALLGATFPMKVADALLATALADEAAAIDMVVSWSHAAPPESAPPEETRSLMRRVAANGSSLLHTDLAACNAYAHGLEAATAIVCPTVFIQGSKDKMTPPRTTGLLTAAIGHGAITSVEAGHAMMAEAPEAVSEALARLSDEVSR